eukprot:CAMPEP_0205904534 /NCGR_PEP_ID=MMETSP1325-20131115/786_1 /ASSEMBLY_ACC=CAM_ASM_000708 /TAXON_ID=236786 /ORGANISM="Florenciella sp., Strain RCC1007" /LENGTH=69 /DNA_ID=CAMNT_0053270323 /DNA_START=72 /DNA_END=278 /DNA_ORIENTATION=+
MSVVKPTTGAVVYLLEQPGQVTPSVDGAEGVNVWAQLYVPLRLEPVHLRKELMAKVEELNESSSKPYGG